VPPGANSQVQSPTHRRVHRSISATSTNPSRRASSGGETLSELLRGCSLRDFRGIFWYFNISRDQLSVTGGGG